MALYIVRKRNPHLPNGTWLERDDLGYQPARIHVNAQGRVEVVGNYGLIYPHETLDEFVIRVQKTGLDKWGPLSRRGGQSPRWEGGEL